MTFELHNNFFLILSLPTKRNSPFHHWTLLTLGDGGDTNTINLDKYFYFPENNSEYSQNNFKIALPNPPQKASEQQKAQPIQPNQPWGDEFTAVQSQESLEKNGGTDTEIELPPLTEIKQEKVDDEYDVPDIPVWHTAKSTSKITMYPSKDQLPTTKSTVRRRLQQIQPKPSRLTTPQVMPPLTQIVTQKLTPKLIAVAVKKIVPIQPKPCVELPQLTQITPTKTPPSSIQTSPQSKLIIKKVSHISSASTSPMNTRRHSTGNSSKIVPTKEILESLKQENIIYQDNEDKPWYCKTCGRNYKWRNSLKQHIKNECGIIKLYKFKLNFNEILIKPFFSLFSQVFHQNITVSENAATKLIFTQI